MPVRNESSINSNEIELIPDLNNQVGLSMSFGKIDFNFSIEINLGNKDVGADGITIVFYNDPDGMHTGLAWWVREFELRRLKTKLR